MKHPVWIPLAMILASAFVTQRAPAQDAADADLIVVGRVITLDAEMPDAEAVVVRNGRIFYVGPVGGANAFRGASTRWIQREGAVIYPGLTDAHGHLANLGRLLGQVRLVGTNSKAECVEKVRRALADAPPGRWILGRGWDQNDWEVQEFPSWRDFEGTDANPIYLRRVGGHAAWVNRAALRAAGITRDTPDPPGGRIVRDERGEATGILIDTAEDLVRRRVPGPSDEERDTWYRAAIAHCNQLGLTGVHDAGIKRHDLEALDRIYESGGLSLRIYCMLDVTDTTLVDSVLATGPGERANGLVSTRALKLYVDGAMGSRGAALLAPYTDDPDNTGLVRTTEAQMKAMCARGLRSGFQVCTHAIGDRGNRLALDAYEAALLENPVEDHRFRIEHCQLIAPEDIGRFARLGVIASMQPTHCTSDMYWVEDRVGAQRLTGAYAWRTIIDTGAHVAWGSDFPVESANPLWGMYAAITRQDHERWPEGGWYPIERVTPMEALQGFTTGAAWAGFMEDEVGSIAPGRRADLTVLDRDVLSVAPTELLEARALITIVDGRVVYEAD